MELILFKINNYIYGLKPNEVVNIEKLSTIEDEGAQIKENYIVKDNVKFKYIDLYKNFFNIDRHFLEKRDDYILFLKNEIFFNTEHISEIQDVDIKKFDFKNVVEKEYIDLFQNILIFGKKIGIVLNANIIKKLR